MIFGTLAWTIELYMTKYIIGEIFSSGGATLYKNPSDQTVYIEDNGVHIPSLVKLLWMMKIIFALGLWSH